MRFGEGAVAAALARREQGELWLAEPLVSFETLYRGTIQQRDEGNNRVFLCVPFLVKHAAY